MADRYRDRPFPADDGYGRNSSYGAQPQQGENDPLAELARLIGQTDPFSNFGREQQQAHAPSQRRPQAAAEHAFDHEEPPVSRPSWIQNLDTRQPQEPAYREDEHYDPRYAQDAPDPYRDAPAQNYQQQHYGTPYQQQDYGAPFPAQPQGQHAAHAAPGERYSDDRYDDVLYGRDPRQEARYGAQDAGYDDGAYDRAPYDEGYEHEPPPKRRGGTMTIAAVLVLAIVGTGAAFAYRTFVGSPRSGEPPVIKADTGPNKVIPPGAGDGSSKQIYDRVGEKSAERVVSREEQPVDINARTGPRVVFPPLTQNVNPPTVASASPVNRPTGPGVGNGTLNGGEEPRKIRTLSIRPDQQDVASAAPVAVPSSGRQQPPSSARASAPASTASTGAPAANTPVSLAPQAQPAAPADRQKVAAVNPSVGTGPGAYVQVSSQKTEADAKASFKALQSKYSGILGSRTASIRRADLGDKGVFYRAMVGPFGTADEATQFCLNLKSAGGQCIVQR